LVDLDIKSCFAPVADIRTRVLVLGSLPGEVSLSRSQYYAHGRNQFWRLMSEVIGGPLPDHYEGRLEVLLNAGIGLWDVVGSARRVGSLDAAIRDHRPNPLAEFCATLPALEAVGFNGGKASVIGRRLLAENADLALVTLPSSSPAHTLAFEKKAEAWRALRSHLCPKP